MPVNMRPLQSDVNADGPSGPEVAQKGTTIMVDTIAAALAVAAIFILPFVGLAVAAMRFGVDSRPTIADRDQRPWLVPTR